MDQPVQRLLPKKAAAKYVGQPPERFARVCPARPIKSHAPFIKIQPHNKSESVKPSLAGQYVALVLSNLACGLLVASAWASFWGGRHG